MGKGLEEASSTAAELSDSLLQAATIWEHPEAPGIASPPPHPLIPLKHPHPPSHTLTRLFCPSRTLTAGCGQLTAGRDPYEIEAAALS